MRHLFLVFLSLGVFALYGCSSLDYLKNRMGMGAEEEPISPTIQQEKELIEKAQKTLVAENYKEAQELFSEFQNKYVASDFYLQSQLGLANAHYGLQEYKQAEGLYKKVASQSATNPKLSTLALYRLGLVYEHLEDSQKALARFLDAYKSKEHLSEALRWAELPGRIASAYMRVGSKKASFDYLKEAERGLLRLQNSEDFKTESKEWRSEILYRMGVLPSTSITEKNFQDILRALIVTQSYLVASIEENAQPWSLRAYEELKQQYQKLWAFIQKTPLPKASDPAIALQLQKNKQVDLLNSFLVLVEHLDQQQIFAPDNQESPLAELAEFTKSMRTVAWNLLQSLPSQTLLSAEAQELQAIRKNLKLHKVTGLKPNKASNKTPKEQADKESQGVDPNL